ncbi:MAG: GTPase domain-containing protein [Crocosphaera sp.]|nr:GTPase domain-containing protein [Crocosphaera sp.]
MQQHLQEFLSQIEQAYWIEKTNTKPFNILIIGKTGVGKSTLVNALFGEQLSATGVGLPVTKTIAEYHQEGFPITVYDTPGLEIFAEVNQEIKQSVARLIADGYQENKEKRIDIVWYCIHERASRYEKNENDWLEEIAKQGIPIILVLTQTFSSKNSEFLAYLKTRNLPVKEIVRIMAKPYQITEDFVVPAHGLDNLVKVTANVLDGSRRKTLISNQIVDVDLQAQEAHRYVDSYIDNLVFKVASITDPLLLLEQLTELLGATSVIFNVAIDKSIVSVVFNFIKKIISELFKNILSNDILYNVANIADPTNVVKSYIKIIRLVANVYIDVLTMKKKAEKENINITEDELIQVTEEKLNTQLEEYSLDDNIEVR